LGEYFQLGSSAEPRSPDKCHQNDYDMIVITSSSRLDTNNINLSLPSSNLLCLVGSGFF
jgi:hypothetical protein